MILPNYFEPAPDELLYSWLYRLACGNSLSFLHFLKAYMRPDLPGGHWPSVDIKRDYFLFANNIGIGDDMCRLFLSTSTFWFESMSTVPGYQTRFSNNAFRPIGGLNTPVNGLFRIVHACPDCIAEDKEKYGMPYLHRSHQLSGVCTCHKHGTPLLEYNGERGSECLFREGDYTPIELFAPLGSLQTYTKYAQTLFEAEINTDILRIKKAIVSKMRILGYRQSGDFNEFIKDFNKWEHVCLWDGSDLERFVKIFLINSHDTSMQRILPIIMFLFPDPGEFTGMVRKAEPLLEQYTCQECGNIYCSTPQAHADGWGCPYCDSALSDEDMFSHLVETIGGGEYELAESFHSLPESIQLIHKKCGECFKTTPDSFLFYGSRCKCTRVNTEEKLKKTMESITGFKVIHFDKPQRRLTILHEECGAEFTCDYSQFIANPYCSACGYQTLNPQLFASRVSELTGDEYTIISDFKYNGTSVMLRHNKCGKSQIYSPMGFLNGDRCSICTNKVRTDPDHVWDKYFPLLLEYKQEYGNISIPQTKIYHGYNLGQWCSNLRRNYQKGNLTPDQIRQLTEIGFEFDPLNARWEKLFGIYKRYVDEHGPGPIPRKAVFEGEHIGYWVMAQRRAFRKGTLSHDRIKKLIDAGFKFDSYETHKSHKSHRSHDAYDAKWEKLFGIYCRYLAEHGPGPIPKDTVFEGQHLGTWVRTQRNAFKKGTLPDERKVKLEKTGFVFDTYGARWEMHLGVYSRYVNEHGPGPVPANTVYEDEQVGTWVKTQRVEYRKGKLSDKRKAKLLAVNPDFFK